MTGFLHEKEFSRQTFLKGGGALIVGFGLAGGGAKAASASFQPPANAVDSWITIRPNNTAELKTSHVDPGNGSATGFLAIMAEELNLSLAQVEHSVWDTNLLVNSGSTSGSNAIQNTGPNVRAAAAHAYQALLGLASAQLGLPTSSLTVERAYPTVRFRRALERPRRRGADGDHPAPLVVGPVHGVGHARRDRHALRRQRVVLDLLRLDRAKGARADVKRELVKLDAAAPDGLEEARREVKPGRRRGDRPGRSRVDGLVALEIVSGRRRESLDVRRQREPAVLAQQPVDRAVQPLDDALAVRVDADDTKPSARVANQELDTRAAATSRASQRPPAVAVDRLDEEELDLTPVGVPCENSRRDHTRVVDDEAVRMQL